MKALYNECDPFAAAWLGELAHAGHIAPGDVDSRDIRDVVPEELVGRSQCHFFAGIGVWSYALRLAGWPDGRPCWTGSCPCQPFSEAGGRAGFADERHLWPSWFHLIGQCLPPVVLGEQVASGPAGAWLDLVHSDLEALGYAVGAVVLPAAGVGAPHARHRIFFVADHQRERVRSEGYRTAGTAPGGMQGTNGERQRLRADAGPGGADAAGGLADFGQPGLEVVGQQPPRREFLAVKRGREAIGVANGDGQRLAGRTEPDGESQRPGKYASRRADAGGRGVDGHDGRPGPTRGFWGDADWLRCRDGLWRPVEPGTFPLAHGSAARVGRLRGFGNAIVAQVAAEFVTAYMEATA